MLNLAESERFDHEESSGIKWNEVIVLSWYELVWMIMNKYEKMVKSGEIGKKKELIMAFI